MSTGIACLLLILAVLSPLMAKKKGPKNPHAVALGKIGGRVRKEKLTPERRREIAKKAIRARWEKSKNPR